MPVKFDPPLHSWIGQVIDTSKEAHRKKMKVMADQVAAAAYDEAPKRSGDLAKSIRVVPRKGGFTIRAHEKYAAAVERGHIVHAADGDHHVAPNPFMRRGLARVISDRE